MQLAKETQARHAGLANLCEPTCGKQAIGSRIGYHAEASISEEPGAIIPLAGIRAGGGRVTALLTATAANTLNNYEKDTNQVSNKIK